MQVPRGTVDQRYGNCESGSTAGCASKNCLQRVVALMVIISTGLIPVILHASIINKADYSSAKADQYLDERSRTSIHGSRYNAKKPLNIVLLYADDLRHDSIGMVGSQPVLTPFLDRVLGPQSIRFVHNCVTTSVCWISRASLLTGQYLSRHKTVKPGKPKHLYKQWNTTFPHLLKQLKNYYVGHVGKWNFYNFDRVKHTYDYYQIYEGRHWYGVNETDGIDTIASSTKRTSTWKFDRKLDATASRIHTTKRSEQDALEFLRIRPQSSNRPFLLTVAFFAPHAMDKKKKQYFPQPETFGLYENITLVPPSSIKDNSSWLNMPHFFTEENMGRQRYHLRFDEPTKYNVMLKKYYRLISEIDQTCQKIYSELQRQNILDQTMVIFTTDNGLFHGEHGLAGKWYPHEESIRVPLIIRDPRMPFPVRNTVDDSFTLNVDLYSTILGAAQLNNEKSQLVASSSSRHQGRDISDIYLNSNGGKGSWRKEFFYEHPMHGSDVTIPKSSALVRKDFKYFVWTPNTTAQINIDRKKVVQLFHVKDDPKEENDLAKVPQYANVLSEMKLRHDQLQESVK